MNNNTIIDAVCNIDGDLIEKYFKTEEKLQKEKTKKTVWLKWSAVAACLCLLMAGILIWRQVTAPQTYSGGIIYDENGVTIPKMDVSLSSNQSMDVIGFFIYNGKSYVAGGCFYGNNDIVGEKLGTATGLIDEWTPKDGYVDFAGSVYGDIYTLKGYDPSFMLCIPFSDGFNLYICNTDITLKYGSELYEDRLHLSDNYISLTYETRDSWYYSKDERYEIDDCKQPAVTDFIKALNEAEFMPFEAVTETTDSADYYKEIYHVYFNMSDGTEIHLRIHGNGYVQYRGFLSICVKIPPESFDAFISLLRAE